MSLANPVSKISIKGFKSIKDLENLRLDSLNILIGSNGAGKSNFISFFKMLSELVDGRLQLWVSKQGGADRILSYGIKETKAIEAFVEFGLNGYKLNLEPTSDAQLTFAEEKLFFDGPYFGKTWQTLGSGHNESLLIDRKDKDGKQIADYCYKSIASWKIFHFHDTSNTAGVKRRGSLHDNIYLRHDASNLAAYLFRLQEEQNDIYQNIRKIVQLAIPFFDDFAFNPRKLPSGEEQINLLWKQKGSDYALWPDQFSDGSIRFICLATALMQPDPPSTLIIDEPELGLHPYAVTLLASLLRSASQRMQIIVATQSVSLVNEFNIDDLIVVDRNAGFTVFNRFNTEDFKGWLEEYTVGELWEKNIFGGRPRND